MNETFDPVTLILIVAAVIVFFKLRGVLGQKTGHQDPFDPFEKPPQNSEQQSSRKDPGKDRAEDDDSNVIAMPGSKAPADPGKDTDIPPVWEGVADKGSKIAATLEQIQQQEHGFSAAQFLDGAKAAYEMIVVGFANADKKSLKDLLSKEVYGGFSSAIDDRKKQGLTMTTQFIGIDHADIVNAIMENKKVFLTVRFVSELVSVVNDKGGKEVEGNASEVQVVTDIWTFERNLSSRDPNWRLVATDGDEA